MPKRRPLFVILALVLGCADNGTNGQGGTGESSSPAFPRIAQYRIETYIDPEAAEILAKVDLSIIDAEVGALDGEGLATIREQNPSAELLAYLTSEELPREVDEWRPLANARFEAVAPVFWLTEPGSTLAQAIDADATELVVEDGGAFRLHPVPSDFYPEDEPTYLLVGGEHMLLTGIAGDTLTVERGFRSPATAHVAGEPVAAHVVFFAGTWMLNLASTAPADPEQGWWRDLLVTEAAAMVTAGPWTGVFLDVCFSDIGWLNDGNLDVDRDGLRDDPLAASQAWTEGMGLLVDELRTELGPEVPIMANPGAQDCPHAGLDGILLEGWPIGLPADYLDFQEGFERYLDWSVTREEPFTVVNAFSPAIGFGTIEAGADELARTDFAAMRLGLTVALMGNGYYTFDNGVFGHYVAWYYDEYDGGGRGRGWLGWPRGSHAVWGTGVLTREFDQGWVVANPTDAAVEVTVPEGFAKLAGRQDPQHNDGEAVKGSLVVPARDGYVLVRR